MSALLYPGVQQAHLLVHDYRYVDLPVRLEAAKCQKFPKTIWDLEIFIITAYD